MEKKGKEWGGFGTGKHIRTGENLGCKCIYHNCVAFVTMEINGLCLQSCYNLSL